MRPTRSGPGFVPSPQGAFNSLSKVSLTQVHQYAAERNRVRGADYVIKRTAFALVTVFIAMLLNFALFRLAPGNAVSNLSRCRTRRPRRGTRPAEAVRARQVQGRAVRHLSGAARPRQLGRLVRELAARCDEPPHCDREHAADGAASAPLFAIVFGTLTGVIAAWRRGTGTERAT